MPHPPDLEGGRLVRRFRLGPYLAGVFTDCASAGPARYAHVLLVLGDDPHEPVFSAAAEIDPSHDRPRLDVFASTGERHEDNGGDWADLDRFTAKALELAAEGLSVAEPPQELPLP